MARPYVMPIGFIDRTTSEGTVFLLNTPEDSLELHQGTSITVWRYSPEQLALAKIRGRISAVGYVTATFRTIESLTDARWPDEEEILLDKTPVYMAIEDTFDPDPRRMLTQEQADTIQNIIPMYRQLRSGDPQNQTDSRDLHEPQSL